MKESRVASRMFITSVQPYLGLNMLWWRRMIDATGREGWMHCAQQIYYTMKATEPLLRFAADIAERKGEYFKDFSTWAKKHLEEEREHYLWYQSDLAAMGMDPNVVDNTIPDPNILRLIGAQFSLVAITNPSAILGYFYATECQPSDADEVRSLADRFSIPRKALRTILFHCSADQDHQIEIRELVDKYSNNSGCYRSMLASAEEALTGWTLLFKDCCERPSTTIRSVSHD